MQEFVPWIEKYRPQKLADVIGNEAVVRQLQSFAKNKNPPHLLFAGPAGSGKTSCAIALARELFGENLSQCLQELNASVAPETPVLVRQNGRIKRTTFGALANEYFNGVEKYAYPLDLEVLSLDEHYRVKFMPVRTFSRHRATHIARVKFEGGSIRTSLDHSVMAIGKNGKLASKRVAELQKNDGLVTFSTPLQGKGVRLDLSSHTPQEYIEWRNGRVRNPRVKTVLQDIELDETLSWLFGLYLAEGCAVLNKRGTSGTTIFTVSYPQEEEVAKRVQDVLRQGFGLDSKAAPAASGFDRSRFSAMQVRVLNTQLAKFFIHNFYDGAEHKDARTKHIPDFVFDAPLAKRTAFMKGYMGDATGNWNEYVRFSSRSSDCLTDLTWLARLTGLCSSRYESEARIVWRLPGFSYIRSELLPAEPFRQAFDKVRAKKYRYFLRHALYEGKKRVSKNLVKEFIKNNGLEDEPVLRLLLELLHSPLYTTLVRDISIEPYGGYVYDFSVPGSEVFWGGTAPVLLHNSDERGIDVVRTKIKDFARTLPLAHVPFKAIFLDEADALTPDAQQALRRTMEKYSGNTRFILSCNYSSRIIEPIQSRCAVFRFARLSEAELKKIIENVAGGEKLKVDGKAVEALVYVSEGDARKAINALQGAAGISDKITAEEIYRVASRARPEEVEKMVKHALDGDFSGARKMLDEMMLKYGMSGEEVILQVFREVTGMGISDKDKVALVDRIGEYDFRMVEGANERIQLEALLAQIMLHGKKHG